MRSFAHRRARNVALIAAGIFLGAAGAALAARQVFVTNGALSGCAQREVGNLRLATPDHPCRNDEESVVWNVEGPAGPPGPRGERGPSGAASLDELAGSPCTIRGKTGVTTLGSPPPGRGFTVAIYCFASDEYEPNDARAIAHSFSALPSPMGVVASIFPAGDHDWFAWNDVTASHWMLGVAFNLDRQVHVELFRDGTLVADGVAVPGDVFSFFNPDNATPADWLLHVEGAAATEYSVTVMPGFTPSPPPPGPGTP
jgi:hypothetical protein